MTMMVRPVAVVTGAGRGLGRAFAMLLAAEGARVVVNDWLSESERSSGKSGPADEVVATIRSAAGRLS